VGLTFIGKGNARAAAFFNNSASTSWQLSVGVNGVTTAVNFLDASGSAASSAPVLSAQGSDTNIDLALTTKGIGGHLFYGGAGTYLTHEAYGQASSVNRFRTTSTASSVSPLFSAVGSDANISIRMRTQGTGSYQFETGSSGNEQLRIANTASAVNYVQVTGAATGSSIGPSFTAAGSDAVVPLTFTTKSTGAHRFVTGAGLAVTFVDSGGTTANFLQIQGRQAGNGPIISAQGSDTNIDLALTPKGTGNVRFGTYTGTVSTIAGYIEIKDSGGTIRRLAVVA
jgi:hypothetical protein